MAVWKAWISLTSNWPSLFLSILLEELGRVRATFARFARSTLGFAGLALARLGLTRFASRTSLAWFATSGSHPLGDHRGMFLEVEYLPSPLVSNCLMIISGEGRSPRCPFSPGLRATGPVPILLALGLGSGSFVSVQLAIAVMYSHEDRYALHRFKADEAYVVGRPGEPIRAYLDIDAIIDLAQLNHIDAIHPGYGFLSENPDFAQACEHAGIIVCRPAGETSGKLGRQDRRPRIAGEKAACPCWRWQP